MKPTLWLLMVFAATSVSFYTGEESYRRTTEDMYRESYVEELEEAKAKSTAEIRAEQYRAMMVKCDEHHNCPPVDNEKNWLWTFLDIPIWS